MTDIISRLAQPAEPKKFVDVLTSGCGRCEFEESTGDLLNHCTDCQLVITRWAHTLFVWEQRKIGVIPVRLRER